MKISASLYSSKERDFEDLIRELDECHIDYFHIDCNDDPLVFEDIKQIRKLSKTPIDLHIISDTPEKYFKLIKECKVEYVTFQYENLKSFTEFPHLKGTEYGLAITSDTPVEVFNEYKDICSYVLIMTTTPGQSGGKFRKDNFIKIRKFRNLFPGIGIHVDGGVNDETGFILRLLGVRSVVSGSYLVNHKSIGTALMHLRSSVIHSDYHVKDFMMDLDTAPVIDASASVKEIFKAIEDFNLGFTILRNDDGTLHGLVSNADMRKGFLKNLDDFNKISKEDIVNTKPVTISETSTISGLLHLISSKSFLINFLPVVGNENQLAGALTFINLIRSES
jgi:pentose-5-phosphate-3-epimerase/CBS domain-containing protein